LRIPFSILHPLRSTKFPQLSQLFFTVYFRPKFFPATDVTENFSKIFFAKQFAHKILKYIAKQIARTIQSSVTIHLGRSGRIVAALGEIRSSA